MSESIQRYAVVIQQSAKSQLDSLYWGLLLSSGEAAASKPIREFEEKARSLEAFPNRGPWLDDPHVEARAFRKMLFGKSYVMIYHVDEQLKTVYIDKVFDSRQDYGWLL